MKNQNQNQNQTSKGVEEMKVKSAERREGVK